ncbi:BEN domain-containing protein 5 [Frankliniella fusca]|uniref:BEN domain-containing protein 5 n=1 Tax=Frankliniella fusca TaxID=407009 RepID=A0AAE1LU76_9NEOP|nr:BEN domain-containing protein 5 [Frankliniella fusca]
MKRIDEPFKRDKLSLPGKIDHSKSKEFDNDKSVLKTEKTVNPVNSDSDSERKSKDINPSTSESDSDCLKLDDEGNDSSDEDVIADRVAKDITGTKPLEIRNGDKLYVGSGICIKKEAWEKGKGVKKDSLFCNNIPFQLWGKDQMASRCLEGNAKGKTKATPRKVKVGIAMFKGRLKSRGVSDDSTVKSLVKNVCRRSFGCAFYEASRPPRKSKKQKRNSEEIDDKDKEKEDEDKEKDDEDKEKDDKDMEKEEED